jgi:diguanylate cyclase (GGDEF)-like protein/PAS domain S-box-containing protein
MASLNGITSWTTSRPLPDASWERRHRVITRVLVCHLPVLVAMGLVRGLPVAHLALDLLPPAALAYLGTRPSFSPRWRSISAALGLMAAAAGFVHLSNGRTEAHFLYFVLLGVLALYEDWVPYAVAVGFVLLEHGVVGAIAPTSLYSDGTDGSPWLWAGVHGGFVLAASIATLVAWRWREADRVAAETRLRASEERFRLMFEAAPIGISLVGIDGRFLAVNPALCQIVGLAPDELLAIDFQAITHPGDLDADLAHLARCLDGSSDGYVMEKRYFHRDGHQVWVELNVAVARDRHGVACQFVAQIIDITERRAATAREARFAAMVEHGSDVMAIVDAGGRLTYASPAFATVLGHEPAEQIGRPLLDHVHADDHEAVLLAGAKLAPGQNTSIRFRHAHADGSWRWVDATVTNRVNQPLVGGYVVNARDVTEQVGAIDRLAHQATHDTLTGLVNRSVLDQRIDEARSAAARRGELVAALFIDLDRFKDVNDTFGHAVGDQLLVQVADRLRQTARLHDVVARMGGDEFVILANVRSRREADELAARVCATFRQPFPVDDVILPVTASVGVATTDQLGLGTGLLVAADIALYQAKARGRDGWATYIRPVPELGALNTVA